MGQPDTVLGTLSDPSAQFGGGHILQDGTLQIFGNSHLHYILGVPIEIQKFSVLRFSINVIAESESFRICLYENKSGVIEEEESLVGDEYRCKDIMSFGDTEISIGSFFDYRTTQINSISFLQINEYKRRYGESEIRSIVVKAGDKEPIFDTFGECNDIDATKMLIVGEYHCECNDKFVASYFGKILGEYDTCVTCIGCFLDGEPCVHNRECRMGACIDSTCTPGVSLMNSIIRYYIVHD